MKKIQNIVVGIDFSVTARGAYRYAKSLAQTLGATLTVVHVKENNSGENELAKDLEQLIAEENNGTAPLDVVRIKVLTGNTVEVLTGLPENTGTDLLVLGSTGLSDVLTGIFGATSLKISNQAHCPVLLVPRGTKWQPVRQVLFASDYDSMTSQSVKRISDLAADFNAGIHFVNVRNYDPILEPKQKDIDWDPLLTAHNFELPCHKATVYGNDTVAELKKYSEANNIDLMAFTSRHRDFWGNLVHKSITGNMAMSANIPVLVMHADDEN